MKSSRRNFVKSAAFLGAALPSTPSFFINKSNPVKGSNRELMMEFMDKDSRSNHIPGGFFMHSIANLSYRWYSIYLYEGIN